MHKPSEHKTVQARILAYAQEIGWTVVPREEAEQRRELKERGLSSPGLLGNMGDRNVPPPFSSTTKMHIAKSSFMAIKKNKSFFFVITYDI
jgi:hypothetical protein